MPGDPLQKVTPGQRLEVPAAAWNAFVDAALAERGRRGDQAAGRGRTIPSADFFLVRNDTGADVDRFAVLALDGPVIEPAVNLDEFQNHVAFAGGTPDSIANPFAILQEPAANGAFARAVLSGVSVVRVLVLDEAHTAAEPAAGDTAQLHSAATGPAELLWKEEGTGTKWAVMRFGGGGTGGGGGGDGQGTCNLAGLRTTDCLEATGPENAVELKYDATSTHWKSTVALTYPGGSGLVEFWYTTGVFHLSVGGVELAGCGDGCFTGGALTGLTVTGSGTEACTGAVLKVCVTCKACAGTLICADCPAGVVLNLMLAVRFASGTCTCPMGHDIPLVFGDYAPPAQPFWRGQVTFPCSGFPDQKLYATMRCNQGFRLWRLSISTTGYDGFDQIVLWVADAPFRCNPFQLAAAPLAGLGVFGGSCNWTAQVTE